jgi:hypothetical protein
MDIKSLLSWNIAALPYHGGVFKDAVAFNQPETLAVWRSAGYAD